MHDFGATHWSSKKVWDRRRAADVVLENVDKIGKLRKVPNGSTPYTISFRLGEEEKAWLDAIRVHLNDVDADIDWQNHSMLLRRAIKMAYIFCAIQETHKPSEKKDEKVQAFPLKTVV